MVLALIVGQLVALALASLIIVQPLIAVGVVYAIGFWCLAWHYPHMALMLIFALAPFQTDIGGGPVKLSFAEIHLGLTVPVLLTRNWIERRPILLGPTAIPIALYFVVCLFSSFQNWRSTAPTSLIQQLLYMVLAVGIFSSLAIDKNDFKLALNGLVCVGVFMALMGMATNYSFLGYNKNGIGASLACCLLVCLELWFSADRPTAKYLLGIAMTIIGVGLIFSLSRGAWLGASIGAVFIVCMRRQFRLLLRTGLILVPLIIVCWKMMPESSKQYATGIDREKNYNIKLRYESVDIAKDYFQQNPIYGMGVGLRKEYDATNVEWLTLAETGVLGLSAFLLIHVVFLRLVWTTRRHFPQTDIRYSLLAIAAALMLYKFIHGSVDHYWSRGAITPAWASVGMAVYAYYAARNMNNIRTSQ